MTIEIDLNHVIDQSIPVVIMLLCFFVGMRVLYGYWPWQEGPKRRLRARAVKVESDTSATLKRPEAVAAPALQPEHESKQNGTAVPRLVLTTNSDDSFDRSLIRPDEARPQPA